MQDERSYEDDMSSQDPKPGEKTRLCPSCRMHINIMATKCRFCGERVDRPRVEGRQLTVEDLGGRPEAAPRVSESMLSAMEAFRAEQANEARRKIEAMSSSDDGLASPMDTPVIARNASSSPWMPKPAGAHTGTMWVIALVAGFVVFSALGGGVFAAMRVYDYVSFPPMTVSGGQSEALNLLSQGTPVIEVLRTATEALRAANTDINRRAIDVVREAVAEEIRALLDTVALDMGRLRQADKLADDAIALDPDSEVIAAARADAKEELFSYAKTMVYQLDNKNDVVMFKMIFPENPLDIREQKARVGDMIRERFVVRRITSECVILEDVKRKNELGQGREVRIYPDGTVR